MAALPRGDGGDARPSPKGDGEAAGAAQEEAVGAEPARRAAARQRPVGDDDVGRGAGADHLVPADEMAGAGGEDPPAAAAAVECGGAQIRAAGGGGQAVELEIIGLGAAELGERVADIVAGAWAEQSEPAAFACARTRWRPSPVTRRSGAGVASAQSAPAATGARPVEPPARAPQADPQAAGDDQGEGGGRHGGEQGDRAGRVGGGVGEPEQEARAPAPVSHQKGAPRPTRSNSKASASSGMMMKVVSGMATTLASAP